MFSVILLTKDTPSYIYHFKATTTCPVIIQLLPRSVKEGCDGSEAVN